MFGIVSRFCSRFHRNFLAVVRLIESDLYSMTTAILFVLHVGTISFEFAIIIVYVSYCEYT